MSRMSLRYLTRDMGWIHNMLIRVIKDFTHKFLPPKDWNGKSGRCLDLHVRTGQLPDGQLFCESAWEPTPEELELLNRGASVVLRVVGGQPPVALYVEGTE